MPSPIRLESQRSIIEMPADAKAAITTRRPSQFRRLRSLFSMAVSMMSRNASVGTRPITVPSTIKMMNPTIINLYGAENCHTRATVLRSMPLGDSDPLLIEWSTCIGCMS